MTYIEFRKRFGFRTHTLAVGDDLEVIVFGRHLPNCRFIKVTRKGFNILDLDTSRCVLKRHLYMKGMGGKEFRKGHICGKFEVPGYVYVKVKEKQVDKVS
jgi:hypothetical protein